MKKVIASILSFAFLSGIFVNPSFAEEIRPYEAAQEKTSNIQLNQPELTAKEKATEKLKSNLKKYENMTDKEFRWYKIKKTFIKIVGAFAGISSFIALCHTYFKDVERSGYMRGLSDGEKSREKEYSDEYDRGFRDGQENSFFSEFFSDFSDVYKILNRDGSCSPDTKVLVKKLLATLHPDSFPKNGKGKNFDDIKDLYYTATNFYDTYLK